MKSVICVVFLLNIFVTLSSGSVAVGQFRDPKHPGRCTIKENLVLSPGEEIKDPDEDCGRIICGLDGYAEFQTCGLQQFDGCQVGDYINKSLQYPNCCERIHICK